MEEVPIFEVEEDLKRKSLRKVRIKILFRNAKFEVLTGQQGKVLRKQLGV